MTLILRQILLALVGANPFPPDAIIYLKRCLRATLLLSLVALVCGCSYFRWGDRSYKEVVDRRQEQDENAKMFLYHGPGTVAYTR